MTRYNMKTKIINGQRRYWCKFWDAYSNRFLDVYSNSYQDLRNKMMKLDEDFKNVKNLQVNLNI